MLRVGVIADDLTGAADTGVQFVRAGYRTAVTFRDAAMPLSGGVDAVAADTDSRALAADDAAARVISVAATLRRAPLLYKKVDSTLRGHIATELRAALDGSGRKRAVVAPAFPAAGRTTRGGIQRTHRRPVAATVHADPLARPVHQAHLPRLLEPAGLRSVVVLSREDVGDPRRVAAAVRAHPCVIADAEDDGDLAALVHGVPDPSDVLWVGSAGLAAALGAIHPGPHVAAGPKPGPHACRGGVLVVIGSAGETARIQVRRLAALSGVTDVPLSLSLLAGNREDEAVAAAAAAAAHALSASRPAVVHTTAAARVAGRRLSRQIPRALAAVAERVAQQGMVEALVLSGGDTAIHVARALGAHGLLIERELEPGVPVSHLLGPRSYPVVTKAGDFGGAATLVEAVEALGGRRSARTGRP